jgi:hypothetical protein
MWVWWRDNFAFNITNYQMLLIYFLGTIWKQRYENQLQSREYILKFIIARKLHEKSIYSMEKRQTFDMFINPLWWSDSCHNQFGVSLTHALHLMSFNIHWDLRCGLHKEYQKSRQLFLHYLPRTHEKHTQK